MGHRLCLCDFKRLALSTSKELPTIHLLLLWGWQVILTDVLKVFRYDR